MKPITGRYKLVLLVLSLLPPLTFGGDGGKDPTGQSLASASNSADTAALAFSKTTYALIPLDAPASDGGTHRYVVFCITDDAQVDFTHSSNTDPANPNTWQTERLLWRRGDIDATTFFQISGREYNSMNRAGQYTYFEYLPDSSGDQNSGIKGMYVRRDGTESEIDFPKYDAEITTQVNEEQNFRLARNGGWSSVTIFPLTAAIVRGFSIFPLEDGTSFGSIDESREYSRTRVSLQGNWPFTDKIWGGETSCEKWGHWGVNGTTPVLFGGALTIKERTWYIRTATMFSAGGMGQDAFCIVDETTVGPSGEWITTHKLRDKTGAVVADLGEQGFKIQGGVPATSRNGHLAKRQTNGCIRYQYPSGEKEILPSAFGSGTGGEGVQVNDVGDLVIQNARSTDDATSDMLVRKFTDPVTQEIVWATRQFSNDALPEGWSGLRIDALANAQPLAKQRELEALTPSAYPPKPEDTPAPMLGGIATKDGKQYPVLLLPVEFKKMWETPNKANQIVVKARRDDPATSSQQPDTQENLYGAPRHMLHITADPADGKYHVSVDVAVGLRNQFVCAAYKSGSKVSNTDKPFPAASDQPANMLIPATGSNQSGEDFVIKIAFDENKNGLIDATETAIDLEALKSDTGSPLPPMVRGFSPSAVTTADSTIQGQAFGTGWTGWKPNWVGGFFVPNAIALENIFYTGGTADMGADYRPTSVQTNISIDALGSPGDFSEWLTHHAGAQFNTDGVASIKTYEWNEQSRISGLIASSSPLATLKNKDSIVSQMQSETTQTVEAYKQVGVPAGQSQIFPDNVDGHGLQAVLASLGKPHWSPSWVSKQTLLIGDEDGYAGAIPDDAFGTVGRSRFTNGKYWFVVKKENRIGQISSPISPPVNYTYTAVVVYLRISGTSEDLYDFNHHSGGLSVPAAITQLSYGNGSYGRSHGVIYRTAVSIFKDYEMKEIRLP